MAGISGRKWVKRKETRNDQKYNDEIVWELVTFIINILVLIYIIYH